LNDINVNGIPELGLPAKKKPFKKRKASSTMQQYSPTGSDDEGSDEAIERKANAHYQKKTTLASEDLR